MLLAKARVGELTSDLERAKVKGVGRGLGVRRVPDGNKSKSEALEEEGISRKEAAECEKIAALKASGDLDRLIAKSKAAPTTRQIVARQHGRSR